jgi:hypothetical protein
MKNPKFVVNPCTGNYFIFAGDGENQGYYWITGFLKTSKAMLCSSYKVMEFPKSPFKRCSIFPVKIPNGVKVRLSYERLCAFYLNPLIFKHTPKVRNFRIFLKTCTLQKTVPLVVFYNDEFKLYCDVYKGKNIYYENK